MKLTDEQIDKLFQDGASKQSFAYKPEYWEEFSASLSDSTPLSEASDEALDAAFQKEAAKQSFEYKPEFWEAFAASLPDNTPLSQASDEALDAAFQEDASTISVPYNPEFWNEFSDELSSIVATENVTDYEVDALYREEAAKLSFVYHPSYWEEMAAMLRRRRRRPEFLWFGLSGVFATAFVAMFFVQQSPVQLPNVEFAWNPLNTAEQNANNLASNGMNGNERGTVNNGNAGYNGNINENNPVQFANNTNNAIAGHASNVEVSPNSNGPDIRPNDVQNGTRINRVTPSLIITTSLAELNRSISEPLSVNEEIELTPLSAIPLRNLTSDENELAAVQELPGFKPYKGGLLNATSFYIQGIGGITESLITPSDAFGTSYGIGAGIQMHKNNWTFNAGSNVIVENYSDLELTRIAKQYIHFSSTESRQDLQYKNLYSLELDLGLGYNFGRHQVRMGIRPSYTYNARVDYSETNVYNDNGEMIESSESRDSQYGYLGALHLWGLKPTIGYSYNLPSNWSIGLNIGTELRPSINEEFITGVNNRLPLDGQLYIRRTLNFTK